MSRGVTTVQDLKSGDLHTPLLQELWPLASPDKADQDLVRPVEVTPHLGIGDGGGIHTPRRHIQHQGLGELRVWATWPP
jgi:hypothetical protein